MMSNQVARREAFWFDWKITCKIDRTFHAKKNIVSIMGSCCTTYLCMEHGEYLPNLQDYPYSDDSIIFVLDHGRKVFQTQETQYRDSVSTSTDTMIERFRLRIRWRIRILMLPTIRRAATFCFCMKFSERRKQTPCCLPHWKQMYVLSFRGKKSTLTKVRRE